MSNKAVASASKPKSLLITSTPAYTTANFFQAYQPAEDSNSGSEILIPKKKHCPNRTINFLIIYELLDQIGSNKNNNKTEETVYHKYTTKDSLPQVNIHLQDLTFPLFKTKVIRHLYITCQSNIIHVLASKAEIGGKLLWDFSLMEPNGGQLAGLMIISQGGSFKNFIDTVMKFLTAARISISLKVPESGYLIKVLPHIAAAWE